MSSTIHFIFVGRNSNIFFSFHLCQSCWLALHKMFFAILTGWLTGKWKNALYKDIENKKKFNLKSFNVQIISHLISSCKTLSNKKKRKKNIVSDAQGGKRCKCLMFSLDLNWFDVFTWRFSLFLSVFFFAFFATLLTCSLIK